MGAAKGILVVDDEATVLLTQKMLLESAGFRVLTADSGKEALRIFKSERVDAVVMDYLMPGLNGITTAAQMKQIKPLIPIVFLSAYAELPGETVGLAQWWAKKGEEAPEIFVARLQSLTHGEHSEPCSMAS